MKKIVIAIPTYNRAMDIRYQLDYIDFLSSYEMVHVVVFDSSSGNQTKDIVESKQRKVGGYNLAYEKLSDKISCNEKAFLIYEKYADFDGYVWILHDHTVFKKEAFDYIVEILETEPDFIFLKMQGNKYAANTYTDMNAFAIDSAWLLTKMGASIIRGDTILANVDWAYYKKKYLQDSMIYFSHVGFYLERISEIDPCKVTEIECPRDQFIDTHRFDRLSWAREAFKICTECWGSVITALPDMYSDKVSILHSIDQYFLDKYKLMEARYEGYYNIYFQIKYRKWIKRVFPDLYMDSFKMALYPKWLINLKYINPLRKLINKERKDGRQIYIYGAGRHGAECMHFFEMVNIDFDGFLVSSHRGNPKKIKTHKVIELKEKIDEGRSIFVILAVMNEMQKEIIGMIKEENKKGADIAWVSF